MRPFLSCALCVVLLRQVAETLLGQQLRNSRLRRLYAIQTCAEVVPLTLLVHFGFVEDHSELKSRPVSRDAPTTSPMFGPREPVAFSKLPVVCHPQQHETVVQLRHRVLDAAAAMAGVDLSRPLFQSTVQFAILDEVRSFLRP